MGYAAEMNMISIKLCVVIDDISRKNKNDEERLLGGRMYLILKNLS